MNVLNRRTMPPEDIPEGLPPHNTAVALIENGTWVLDQKREEYSLRCTVNRLGNPQLIRLGHIHLRVWHSDQGPAARNEVWREAFNFHSSGPQVDRQSAPAPITHAQAILN